MLQRLIRVYLFGVAPCSVCACFGLRRYAGDVDAMLALP